MTRDPILNSAMKKHPRGQVRVYDETGKRIAGTSCGGYLSEFEESRKPRTVTTAAELDALPVGSVVLDADEDVWQCYVRRERPDGTLRTYWECGEAVEASGDFAFPATVLHEGPAS